VLQVDTIHYIPYYILYIHHTIYHICTSNFRLRGAATDIGSRPLTHACMTCIFIDLHIYCRAWGSCSHVGASI
jgi:hypothetical protein